MKSRTYVKTILVLAIMGVLFSGYLTFSRLLTGSCAFNEPCPFFLGYPACWYGFGMFFLMFLASLAGFSNIISARSMKVFVGFISFLGILFAGRFVVLEFQTWLNVHNNFALGLPTCAYGLIFYVLIFALSIMNFKHEQAV